MPSAGVIKAIDIVTDFGFSLGSGLVMSPPDELRFQGFEQGLDHRIVIAIALA